MILPEQGALFCQASHSKTLHHRVWIVYGNAQEGAEIEIQVFGKQFSDASDDRTPAQQRNMRPDAACFFGIGAWNRSEKTASSLRGISSGSRTRP